jgi:RNA polymerase sigma-70 factor (ECF subfamily)
VLTAEETLSDADLVAAALAGRTSAFAELARRHERSVLAAALGVLRDHHAAQDVTQEALLTAYRKLASLRDARAFGPWVLRIADRAARRKARGSRRRRQTSAPLQDAGDVPAPAVRQDMFDDEEHALLAAVARLPRAEREVVHLRHFEGEALPDIARVLGRPLGTVTKQLSRAHQRLREQLQDLRP